jgi:uroporphyrinogen decarboxylase
MNRKEGEIMMDANMSCRERVLAALNHHEPDQVPIDLGATLCSTLTRVAYHYQRSFLGMDPDLNPVSCSRTSDSVYLKEDLAQHYCVDFRPVRLGAPDNFISREDADSFYDEYGARWRRAAFYYDAVERPFSNFNSVSDLKKYSWPNPYDPGRVRGVGELAKQLYEATDYAIVADIAAYGPFETALYLRGYEQFLVDLHLDPDFAQATLDMLTENAMGFWEAFLTVVGDYVHVVAQADDLGMQTGPYISPKMYRQFVKPCHKRLNDFIHSKTKAKLFLHSCGSIYDLIPDFVEVGFDALNPVQRSASKMDIVQLKKVFGKDISFWGGAIDSQHVFPNATLEEIEIEVKRTLDVMGPGGGYIFNTVHNIQPDVSPDRIEQLFQTAIHYRKYPLGHRNS